VSNLSFYDTPKKMARDFSVEVTRLISAPHKKVFEAWVNPEIRRSVLLVNNYKNSLKECNPVEGGIEFQEGRHKNSLMSTTTRRYLVIRPSSLIISHVEHVMINETRQFFATQESIVFNKVNRKTEIVISSHHTSIMPFYIHAAEDHWNWMLDAFEAELAKLNIST
jgi:uncharacterized protein YndB with AHSA1/START domain